MLPDIIVHLLGQILILHADRLLQIEMAGTGFHDPGSRIQIFCGEDRIFFKNQSQLIKIDPSAGYLLLQLLPDFFSLLFIPEDHFSQHQISEHHISVDHRKDYLPQSRMTFIQIQFPQASAFPAALQIAHPARLHGCRILPEFAAVGQMLLRIRSDLPELIVKNHDADPGNGIKGPECRFQFCLVKLDFDVHACSVPPVIECIKTLLSRPSRPDCPSAGASSHAARRPVRNSDLLPPPSSASPPGRSALSVPSGSWTPDPF